MVDTGSSQNATLPMTFSFSYGKRVSVRDMSVSEDLIFFAFQKCFVRIAVCILEFLKFNKVFQNEIQWVYSLIFLHSAVSNL